MVQDRLMRKRKPSCIFPHLEPKAVRRQDRGGGDGPGQTQEEEEAKLDIPSSRPKAVRHQD